MKDLDGIKMHGATIKISQYSNHKRGWHSNNALDLYSGDTWLEYHTACPLSRDIS